MIIVAGARCSSNTRSFTPTDCCSVSNSKVSGLSPFFAQRRAKLQKYSLRSLIGHKAQGCLRFDLETASSLLMAGPPRYFGVRGENNESGSRNPPQYALNVRPLNSVPYIGSPSPVVDNASSPTEGDTKPVKTVGPSMVFLSSTTTQKELDNVLASVKGGVILSGSATTGSIGPLLGKMNLAESDDSYLFRIALPGVSRDKKEFSCDIEPDGKVIIMGVRTTGEKIVCKYSKVFKMQSQNLGPPGRFSISFHLPGPVDQQQFTGTFGDDGILEAIVKKRQLKCEI